MQAGWLHRFLQVGAVGALLFFGYLGASRGVAEWLTHQPKPQGLEQALAWESDNPDLHLELARFYEQSSLQGDTGLAIQHYERAANLNPHHAQIWADLGGAYETYDEPEKAVRAYEEAVRLFPNSPEVNWRLANFYIRQGRLEEAGRALQKVMGAPYPLRQQAFDLAWRAGLDPDLILSEMIPPHRTVSFQYLQYLSAKGHVEEAIQAWEHILASGLSFEPRAAFPYLDTLIKHGRVEELQAAWRALAEQNPMQIRAYSRNSNALTNSDFEGVILNGGLGWRVVPVEGVVVRVDTLTRFDGTHSLQLRFDGQHNVEYRHIYQYAPVRPNTLYRFTGYLRTEKITTDSGVRFVVQDTLDPTRLRLLTESVVGTTSWSLQQMEFRTGEDTRLVTVQVARPASRKFNNKISGTAWVDRVSLTSVE